MDASQAGEGSLEILVQSARGLGPSVPTRVEHAADSNGEARFLVSFTPDTDTEHVVHITFNEDNVPGNNNNKGRNQHKE